MPLALCLVALGTLAMAGPDDPGRVRVLDDKERAALAETDVVRLSLPTREDVAAWASPGLRVQLGLDFSVIEGVGPAWSWTGPGMVLRPSLRIDERWAMGVALAYGTGPRGVRWSVTAEPTFVPWRQLAVSVGLGFGGLSVSKPGVPVPATTVSRDLVAGETLDSCTGSAVTSVLRLEYLFVVGPLFASGPFLQAHGQWTHCEWTEGFTDRETGRPAVLTQWWRQVGASLGWWLAWR